MTYKKFHFLLSLATAQEVKTVEEFVVFVRRMKL